MHHKRMVLNAIILRDYKIKFDGGIDIEKTKEYINKPCPKCGRNLLTERDFNDFKNMFRIIKFINKYFSWLTYIIPKNETILDVKVHDGFKITKDGERTDIKKD